MNQTVRRQPALQRLNYHEETVILQKKNVNQNAKRWNHGKDGRYREAGF